jgi:ribosomal protein L16 Arg81 hydroxylase
MTPNEENAIHLLTVLEARLAVSEFSGHVELNRRLIADWEAHRREYPIRSARCDQAIQRLAAELVEAERLRRRFTELAESANLGHVQEILDRHAAEDRRSG